MKILTKTCIACAVILLALVMLTGCIRSRVIITSEPPGADVTFKRTYRGRTPITIPIIWYWFYEIKLEKEGYETIETRERFHAPVWFYMPLDLIAEAMPFPIYDTKRLDYTMIPEEAL